MSEPDENGLPTKDEFSKIDLFEDRLVPAVSGFMERLTNIPQEEERYPITIHNCEDPDWSYFYSVITG